MKELKALLSKVSPNDATQIIEAVTQLTGNPGSVDEVYNILCAWNYFVEGNPADFERATVKALEVWRTGGCTLEGWIRQILDSSHPGYNELTGLECYCLANVDKFCQNAMQLTSKYNHSNGTHIDWHEFSQALDHLNTRGMVRVIGHSNSGMTNYERR